MSTATTHGLQRLVEALEDFECWYEGELLKIRAKAGQFFAVNHPVVLAHPEKFGLTRTVVLGSERVSEAREKTARRPPKPKPAATRRRVEPAGPSLPVHMTTGQQIRITQRAMGLIAEECARWHGQIETGGGLCLNVSDKRPVIIDASARATDRERAAVYVDLFSITFDRRVYQRDACAEIGLGHWHSHPGGDPEPSESDLEVWEQLLDKSRDRAIYGVIVCEEYNDGWQETPTLHAYKVRRGLKPISGTEALLVERCSVERLAR